MAVMNAAAPTLHYIYDPLCGWCYAAAPLVEAARSVPGLAIEPHAGGMLSGANARRIDARWRDYVMPHDRRIAQASGQPFGDAYFDGLLLDTSAMMDSTPPIAAVLAAEALAGRGLDLLHRLQRAHYVEGRRIADADTLRALAVDIGLDGEAFATAMRQLDGAPTARHIEESRELLSAVGGHGFPTFVLERSGQRWTMLDIGPYLGRADAWRDHLAGLLAHEAGPSPEAAPPVACGPDGCAIDA